MTARSTADEVRRDRRALASVAVQFFANGAIFASFVPRLPEIRDRIDIGVGGLGVLLAVASACGLVGSSTVGRMIEAFGSRRVLIAAAMALVASLLLVAFAASWPVLAVGLALLSVFDVYVDAAMNLQGSRLSARRATPVMNRLHGLWSLGTVVGGVIAARAAASGVGLRTHLVVVAAILGVLLVFVGRGLLRVDDVPAGDDGDAGDVAAEGERGRVAAARVARRRVLLVLGVAGAASIMIEMTSSDWAAFRLSDDLGAGAGLAGLGYVAFTAGMTIGRLVGDAVLARVGQARLFVAGMALTAIGAASAAFVDQVAVVVVGYLCCGLGVATQFPRLYDEAARTDGRPGAGLGALTAGSRIALLVAPLVVGSLADSTLSVGVATAVVVLPATLTFAVVARPRPASTSVGRTT